jgi:hypothetical protein
VNVAHPISQNASQYAGWTFWTISWRSQQALSCGLDTRDASPAHRRRDLHDGVRSGVQ